MLSQRSGHLSVGLAGNVSVGNRFFKIRPEDVDPLSQHEWDAHCSLETILHRSLSPDRVNVQGRND